MQTSQSPAAARHTPLRSAVPVSSTASSTATPPATPVQPTTPATPTRSGKRPRAWHPVVVRITHWINAFAIVCMVMSGWGIYNASPLFALTFPAWATLGGWLGGSIAWHLATMWLLVVNGVIYLLYGLFSGHFRRDFLPLSGGALWRDFVSSIQFRLQHKPGTYNAVQRLLYMGVLVLGVLVVASGLSIWKPVQLSWLTSFFGGYDFARRVHFAAMAGIVAFVVVHLALVIIVPSTLLSMITGRAHAAKPGKRSHAKSGKA